MKIKSVAFASSLFFLSFFAPTSHAVGSCGGVPIEPALLSEPQIDLEQLDTLAAQMKAHDSQMSTFVECLEDQASSIVLDTSGFTQAQIDSGEFLNTPEYTEYQSQIDALSAQIDAVLETRESRTDKFNTLIVTAAPTDSPEN